MVHSWLLEWGLNPGSSRVDASRHNPDGSPSKLPYWSCTLLFGPGLFGPSQKFRACFT